jgi:hypothetical protein
MDDDLTITYSDIRDWTPVDRDGTVRREKRVVFYIGKFGPFTEYFPAAGFSMNDVAQRRSARAQLRALRGRPPCAAALRLRSGSSCW